MSFDIKAFFNTFVEEVKEFKNLKFAKFTAIDTCNYRFDSNVKKFKFIYGAFVGLVLLLTLLIKPVLIVSYAIQAIAFIVIAVMKKFDIKIQLPTEMPFSFIVIIGGYLLACIAAYMNECFLLFFLPIMFCIVIIRLHSCLAVVEGEEEYENGTKHFDPANIGFQCQCQCCQCHGECQCKEGECQCKEGECHCKDECQCKDCECQCKDECQCKECECNSEIKEEAEEKEKSD